MSGPRVGKEVHNQRKIENHWQDRTFTTDQSAEVEMRFVQGQTTLVASGSKHDVYTWTPLSEYASDLVIQLSRRTHVLPVICRRKHLVQLLQKWA